MSYLQGMFRDTGFSEYWGTQIDDTDAYLRKLREYRDAVSNGFVDIDTTQLEEIPRAVEEATKTIESMDLRMEATVDIDADQLKQSEGVLDAIRQALERIRELKIQPVTPESLALIKEYKSQVNSLIGVWGKLQKGQNLSTIQLSRDYLKNQQPELYNEMLSTYGMKQPKPQKDSSGTDWKKLGGTITRATLGVRSLFFFVRKIVSQNEYLSNAVNMMFETIAGVLKPVLDFIASLIVGLAKILGRIFKVEVGVGVNTGATASNTEKQLTIARFDELEVLNRASGGSIGGGLSSGYADWLDRIDEKLKKIYDLIDKLRGTIDKADLPNSDDTVEGIIASGASGSQSPSGIGFSWGTNKDNETIENVYEAWEDAKVDWVLNQLEKIKTGFKNLKESIKQQNEEIAQNTMEETDRQVEKWITFGETLKVKWEELKQKYAENNAAETERTIQETERQIEAWKNFKSKVEETWGSLKTKFHEVWEGIVTKATEVWERVKESCINAFEKVKTAILNVPSAIQQMATNAWNGIRNFGNNIIYGVETALNNIIWKINNSGLVNILSKVFGEGFQVGYVSIPRLAGGGVIKSPTVAQMGEYPGASSNPEIVAPQSILKETIDASNGELASVFVQVGRQLIDAINNKDLEVNLDDKTIAKSASRGNRAYQLATGQSLF